MINSDYMKNNIIKRDNKKIGIFGEKLASDFLIKNNYCIIGKNVYVGHKEIDIICKKDELTVFVEVKINLTREFLAENNMTREKTKKLKKAIKEYAFINKISPDLIRLDLVSIDLDIFKKIAKVKHFKDIF